MLQTTESSARTKSSGGTALQLKPPSATRNLMVIDALTRPEDGLGGRVSALLAAGYENADFDDMPIVDRQSAVLRLALDHGSWPAWFVMGCAACGAKADLQVSAGEFAPAWAPSAPHMVAEHEGARIRFRRPAGRDEALLRQGITPLSLMAVLLLDPPLPPEAERSALLPAFAEALEGELARARFALPFDCPACAAGNLFWFDPYQWMARHAGGSLREVHRLALRYGWSEAEILAMPEARRRAYLALGEAH